MRKVELLLFVLEFMEGDMPKCFSSRVECKLESELGTGILRQRRV